MAEERIANTQVRGHRTAKISGQQNCAEHGRGLYEFDDAVRNQEKYNQSAENAPGPEAFLRHRNSSRIGWHEFFLQMSFQLEYNKFAKSFPSLLQSAGPPRRTCPYPPAIAPMMSSGSTPDATASGRGASGGS